MAKNFPAVNEFLRQMQKELQIDIEALNSRIERTQKQIDDDREKLAGCINEEAEVSLWLKEHGGESNSPVAAASDGIYPSRAER